MSGRVEAHELERFEMLGVAGVILKPFDPMKLAERVRDVITLSKRQPQYQFFRAA